MAGCGGGSSSPSYSQIVANRSKGTGLLRFKKPLEVIPEDINIENIKPHGHKVNHEKDIREKRKEVSS